MEEDSKHFPNYHNESTYKYVHMYMYICFYVKNNYEILIQ